MRTPKYTVQDLEEINRMLEGDVNVADVGRLMGISYQTLLKMKKGVYVPNTRPNAKSGLTPAVSEVASGGVTDVAEVTVA